MPNVSGCFYIQHVGICISGSTGASALASMCVGMKIKVKHLSLNPSLKGKVVPVLN
jgi:hypothetical protein